MVKVKEVMKKYVISIGPEMNLADVAKIMSNNRIGSVVILDKGKPVNIVTSEDIVSVVARGNNPKKTKVKDLRKRMFITASPDENLLDITKKMVKNNIKRIPVISNGKLQGIISEKEVLITAPEMIDVLSEKLKARVSIVAQPDQLISGICEGCESYSDELKNIDGKWLCEECREG